MSQHYPRIRIYSSNGRRLLIRDTLSVTFYMNRLHPELAPEVLRAVDRYLTVTNARLEECIHYSDHIADWYPVDDEAWTRIRKEILEDSGGYLSLEDEQVEEGRHAIGVRGRTKTDLFSPGLVSSLRFWFPTEYLEEHGPHRARDLALDLLAPLPIC